MIHAKQVARILGAFVRLNGFTANGADDNATSAITSALATAGNKGVGVPVQVSSNEDTIGIVVSSPSNIVSLYDATTKDGLTSNGAKIYGKLTHSSGVYTIAYFTTPDGGTETSYSFPTNTAIDVEFVYRFDFVRIPADALVAVTARNINDDAASGSRTFAELLTVSALNTVSNLSKTPSDVSLVTLIVNEATYNALGGASAPFSVAGKVITWSPANAKFNLDPADSDRVIAFYWTNE